MILDTLSEPMLVTQMLVPSNAPPRRVTDRSDRTLCACWAVSSWNTRDLQSNNAVGQIDEVRTRGVADNFNNHMHHRTRRRSPGADVDTAVTFNNTPVAPAGTTCLLTLVEVASRQVSTIPVNVTFRAAPATN